MNKIYEDIIKTFISLPYCIHKLTLIYVSVFTQYFKAKEGEAYNG